MKRNYLVGLPRPSKDATIKAVIRNLKVSHKHTKLRKRKTEK